MPDDSVASKTPRADGASAVDGEASHRRVAAGLGTSGLHTDECWECHAPVTPILWGIRRYLVVLCRYPAPLPQGIPCESQTGIPRLSDCPDMGAVVPPRSGVQMGRTVKSTLTRFTPAVNGGILSLAKDSDYCNCLTGATARLRVIDTGMTHSNHYHGGRPRLHRRRRPDAPAGRPADERPALPGQEKFAHRSAAGVLCRTRQTGPVVTAVTVYRFDPTRAADTGRFTVIVTRLRSTWSCLASRGSLRSPLGVPRFPFRKP